MCVCVCVRACVRVIVVLTDILRFGFLRLLSAKKYCPPNVCQYLYSGLPSMSISVNRDFSVMGCVSAF